MQIHIHSSEKAAGQSGGGQVAQPKWQKWLQALSSSRMGCRRSRVLWGGSSLTSGSGKQPPGQGVRRVSGMCCSHSQEGDTMGVGEWGAPESLFISETFDSGGRV